MRFYVIAANLLPDIGAHVIAEVVRDGADVDPDRMNSLAGSIAGERASIATRDELESDPIWAQALRAWDRTDDSDFDRETVRLAAEEEVVIRRLRLVPPADIDRITPMSETGDDAGGTR
jgi:hypothetical protein